MAVPNTLIFVDPAAAGAFHAGVFGRQNDARPRGVHHRMGPARANKGAPS